MNVELISITPNCEEVIEQAGRTCYQSKVGNPKIIQAWIKSGHESVIEHSSATFKINGVSRSLTHQLVRHRISSFSQQSQRYVKENGFEYVTPSSIKNSKYNEDYNLLMSSIQTFYDNMVKEGIKKEDARFILPNACTSEIVFTMNFRAMRNFFKLRLDKHAQWEIRNMAGLMLDIIKPLAPNVFSDIEK